MQAHLQNMADRGTHGVPMSVATDPANQGQFEVVPLTDFAARAIEYTKAARHKEFPDDPQHGVVYLARLRQSAAK